MQGPIYPRVHQGMHFVLADEYKPHVLSVHQAQHGNCKAYFNICYICRFAFNKKLTQINTYSV